MKLLRATQLHMLYVEIVSHYFALIYEIRSHFKFKLGKQYKIVSHAMQFLNPECEIVSQIILTH